MKSFFAAVLLVSALFSPLAAHAGDSFRDVFRDLRLKTSQSQEEEPTLQSDEDSETFAKGKGSNANNSTSVVDTAVTFEQPSASGNGCPANTVGVALTPDKKTLSLIFDAFIAEAGNSSGLKKDIKKCTVTVPMVVPAGLQFTVVKIDYRGYNLVPEKAKNRYITMYSLTDSKNRQVSRRVRRQFEFPGAVDDLYTVSSEIKNAIWSPCGKDVNMRIDARAIATTNKAGDDTMATIDSLDAAVGSTKAGYHLMWRKCSSRPPWWFWGW